MRRRAERIVQHGLLAVAVVFFLFPILWIVLTALKPGPLTFAYPPVWFFEPTLDNFTEVLGTTPFPRYMFNSIVVGFTATTVALTVGTLAAYGFARYRYPREGLLRFLVFVPQAIPPIVVVLPIYMMFRVAGLLDNVFALAFTYLSFTIPLATWLMIGFIQDLPEDLEDAARVDGATLTQVLRFVVVPLIRPGLAAAAVICLLYSWNEFLLALILTGSDAKTAPAAILSFVTNKEILWGRIAAAGLLVMLPVLLFGALAQRHLVRGLTSGSYR